MKRSLQAAVAAAVGLLGAFSPAAASAKIIELGTTSTPLVAPSCPSGIPPAKCTIILTQVTALETIRDGLAYPTTVRKAGSLVAVTLGLSRLDPDRTKAKQDIHFLDTTYGGVPLAQLTILRRVGKNSDFRWKMMAQSAPIHLIPYLGQVAQFPLDAPLHVDPGDTVALTTPTWAPVLSFNLNSKKFAYRQSRRANCNNPAVTSQAQTLIGGSASYKCDYPGTRVEYTATEVTDAAPTKNYVHAPDRASAASVPRNVPGQQ